ncbi:hypothetical protein A2634_02420 [Candidatus Amesbacteria bacterium RIFCSPHIGHO2_01_FULL_48_32]|nr:MAG: hypothetical protein A2634_02420 [Candidatus Amesbacteria bacterium RIFCSPHIGHO2_01_FULL_48_32]HJZ06282.1 hypothetical protein [Patescibacteria group bacterium]
MWRRLIFNAPRMVSRRKLLRNNPTKAESILWTRLRKSQLGVRILEFSNEEVIGGVGGVVGDIVGHLTQSS